MSDRFTELLECMLDYQQRLREMEAKREEKLEYELSKKKAYVYWTGEIEAQTTRQNAAVQAAINSSKKEEIKITASIQMLKAKMEILQKQLEDKEKELDEHKSLLATEIREIYVKHSSRSEQCQKWIDELRHKLYSEKIPVAMKRLKEAIQETEAEIIAITAERNLERSSGRKSG